ncbi:hypothetical protein KPL47_06020 [Clostridium estertheticum]|uniref:hypothetical protein n=1 Tax=Clostridium estertheticum TaxID=238834 RepID=UPI001C0C1FD0|nr:hypothetical protein [Clostridium estertheticum]MBU3175922.1 hypothetical protein [Clostridium estertheticum]
MKLEFCCIRELKQVNRIVYKNYLSGSNIIPILCEDLNKGVIHQLIEDLIDVYEIIDFDEQDYPVVETEEVLNLNKLDFKYDSKHVIVCFNKGDELIAALLHSFLTNKKLYIVDNIEDLTQISGHIESMVIFSSNDILSMGMLEKINGFAKGRAKVFRINWGVMASKDPLILMNLVVKNYIYKFSSTSGTYTSLQAVNEAFNIDEPNRKLITRQLGSFDDFIFELSSVKDLFTIYNHGRADSVGVQDGIICGKNSLLDICSKKLPACGDGAICNYPERNRVLGKDIKSKIVFINSCSALKLNESVFSVKYHLTESFIEGWVACLVAYPMLKAGEIYENLLIQNLILCGYTIGNANRILNNSLVDNNIDHPINVLIGDPDFRIDYRNDIFLIDSLKHDNSNILYTEIDNINSPLIRIRIRDISIIQKIIQEKYSIRVHGKLSQQGVLYFVRDYNSSENILDILIFSLGQLVGKGVKIEICLMDASIFDQIKMKIVEPLKELKSIKYQLGNLQVVERNISEIENQLIYIMKNYNKVKFEINENKRINIKTNKLKELIKATESEIINYLIEKTSKSLFNFTEFLREKNYLSQSIFTEEKCYVCNKNLYVQNLKNIYNDNIFKEIISCPDCGVLFNYPHADKKIEFIISGNQYVSKGSTVSFEAVIINNSESSLDGYIGLVIVNQYNYGIKSSPNIIEMSVQHKEQQVFKFNYEIPEKMVSHNYWIRGYIVYNGKIYYSGSNLWISKKNRS